MTTPSPTHQPDPPTQPLLGGRDIGITYFAIAGLRDALLAEVGMTFEDSLLLDALAGHGGSATRADLVDVLTGGPKIAPGAASTLVDMLIEHGLAAESNRRVTATAVGNRAHERFSERVASNAPRLYGGIPDADLATTRRVLAIVRERANRELQPTARP